MEKARTRERPGRRGLRRRTFLGAVTAGAGAAVLGRRVRAGRAAGGRKRPNVLLIITDQQHAGMLSCAGNPHLRTPALDALAAGGARMERAYPSNPVCLPSRFSMMTGHMPSRLGIRDNGGIPRGGTVPEGILASALGHLFRRAGYRTLYGGKTHWPRGMTVRSIGFAPLTPDQRDGLAEACERFLRGAPAEPWLLVASFINPHDICFMAIDAHAQATGGRPFPKATTARRHLAEALRPPPGVSAEAFVRDRCPPLPPNFEIPDLEPECVTKLVRMRPFRAWVREHWTEADWRRHRWAYCRLTERVDGQIGRVLAALRASGQEDRTLVVMVSDHGDMDSAHRMEHKTVLYEEASRVPMLVRYPGVVRAGLVDRRHLVSTGLDLLPTLCDFAGIDPPEGLRGRSLRPILEGRAPDGWREELVVESQVGRMLRTDRFKYNCYEDGAHREQLVDLQADPGEMVNLAERPDHEAVLKDHRRRLCRWVDATGDPVARSYVVREG